MRASKTFFDKLRRRRMHPIKPSEKEEDILSECPHSFGYLAIRPKDVPIPQECLFCRKLADCMVITVA